MFMIDYKQIDWWYWFVTACLLTIGLAGYAFSFYLVVALSFIQIIHFSLREKSTTAFIVQVRIGFFLLVLAVLPEQLHVVYWLPALGTWARSIFGYCLMARTLSLLPWNRATAFSLELLAKTFLTKPVRGNILQGFLAAS